ncbi:ABC transporter transmembrane domain-containing protein [Enterovirga rhinocerotis]|uniref:Putative ABC transport system ATP-binding protein n=1 Tax=Enterovirga rhinocerotis TaxID=1339210 RepID=A0A4V3DYZ4_9HYPH|nr:ABC transporter ATP-binding protein [Enterovirga rhinocerotis]TDR93979.1 putative ABC transport system ATP-binding protein [Enterovirga rhinocerotis]
MTKSLFRYIWRHSRRDQLIIFAVVLGSLPFFYMSLDLPRKIVNEAIQGRAFEDGRMTAPFLDFAIHWPSWLGGGETQIVEGVQVGRLELLFGLSFLFLFFVLVNGFIKYWINVQKGALGERMMRRLRFELFSYALRFTPEALRNVRSAEAATIIKDEVEPIGGFIGDAYIQPLMLGTQAATALTFILIQSLWLGLLAAAIVGAQFIIIPRLRRQLLVLGRQRQLASREFAGRVSEVIDGMEAVQVHDTAAWERAEIGGRLHHLFDIRFKIYKRKFIVKFLNNLLAQMTPFFFYAVGGYFALSGKLDIGQLVAVIAAYRELPPPLKELIDWDQQRLDVQVKYDQVVAYFAPERLRVVEDAADEDRGDAPLEGALAIKALATFDGHGSPLIRGGDVSLDLPSRVAILSDGTAAASNLARILARRDESYGGEVTIGDRHLSALGHGTVGRRIAYAGPEPILFPGTIRDNLIYGLRQRQIEDIEADEEEQRRIVEAKRTGNPLDSVAGSWIDLDRSGAKDHVALDAALLILLDRAGLGDDVYRFGLTGLIDPERQPGLAERVVEARHRLRERLEREGKSELVESFDQDAYNAHATVVENLLFGMPTSPALKGRAIVEHAGFRAVLDQEKLTDDLVRMGVAIAETMTDIFEGLPQGHPLFEQFAFVHADELDEFAAIVKRSHGKGRGGLTRDDRERLLALPLEYIEPRHRLGILDEAFRERLLQARKHMRAMLEERDDPGVEFYDPDRLTLAAPLQNNLIFGRVNASIADAREQLRAVGAEVVAEMDLSSEIERVGLDHAVGPAGRRLTAHQRAIVNLVRCLVKRPDLLVVDGALAPFGEKRVAELTDFLLESVGTHSLVMVLPNDRHLARFEKAIAFEDGHLVAIEPHPSAAPEPREAPSEDDGEERGGEDGLSEAKEGQPGASRRQAAE